MKLDPENRVLDGVSTFLSFVALNLLYLVTCLPLVTIPLATAALFEVTIRYSDAESGRLLKGYFAALRANWLRATAAGLALIVPIVLLVFAAFFWLSSPQAFAFAAAAIAFLAALYLFAAFLYAMALVARYRGTVRRTLKNAFLLPGAEPLRTGGIVLIPLTMLALTVIFPVFGILLVTIGFSVGAYGSAFLFRSVFARHAE